jgi:hypothetical protein
MYRRSFKARLYLQRLSCLAVYERKKSEASVDNTSTSRLTFFLAYG